jgi:hypothetical protein
MLTSILQGAGILATLAGWLYLFDISRPITIIGTAFIAGLLIGRHTK